MAQKKPNKPTSNNIIITVVLPEDEATVRTGQIVVKRDTLARVSQFEFTNLDDIMRAIESSASDLIALEQNPPPKLAPLPFTPGKPAQAASPVPVDQPDTEAHEGDEERDDEAAGEASTETEEAVAGERTPAPTASAQPTLF